MWAAFLSLLPLGQSEPPGRYSHCAVMYNGHMIVYGGRGFQEHKKTLTTLGDVWSLNLDEMSWSLLVGVGDSTTPPPDLDYPGDRSSHACVLLRESESEGELLMFGGLMSGRSGEPQTMQNDAWKLRLRGGGGHSVSAEWEYLHVRGAAPRPRSDHTAVVVEDGVLVYGGCVGGDVYGDLWLLHEQGTGSVDDPFTYSWVQLDARAVVHLPPPSPSMPVFPLLPPSPPGAPSTGDNGTAADVKDEMVHEAGREDPDNNFMPPPAGDAHATPNARCAHTAAAHAGGMLLFGGRMPLPQASRDESWLTLSDTWFLDYRAARRSVAGTCGTFGCELGPPASLSAGDWQLVQEQHSSQLLLNRSDHAAVLHESEDGGDPALLLFGGLYTDVAQDTIYIMKDFLRMSLPDDLAGGGAPTAAGGARLRDRRRRLRAPLGGGIGGWDDDEEVAGLLHDLHDLMHGKQQEEPEEAKQAAPPPQEPARRRRGLATSTGVAHTERLEWAPQWPAWRFDHTLVVAPKVTEVQPNGHERTLRNAPVLYGGGGGMDIFSDVWVYDIETLTWHAVSPMPSPAAAQMVTSLLFGTAAFVLYVCVIVCVFRRRLSRGGFQPGFNGALPGAPSLPAAPRHRGISQSQIDSLPRTLWADTPKAKASRAARLAAKVAAHEVVEMDIESARADAEPAAAVASPGKGKTPSPVGERAAAGGSGGTAVGDEVAESEASDEDGDCCPVCLNPYNDADLVIQLPCNHVFHEPCIARWLVQEPSCPQCRLVIAPTSDGASGRPAPRGVVSASRAVAATIAATSAAAAAPPPSSTAASAGGGEFELQPMARSVATHTHGVRAGSSGGDAAGSSSSDGGGGREGDDAVESGAVEPCDPRSVGDSFSREHRRADV